jgi:hypothetical protein
VYEGSNPSLTILFKASQTQFEQVIEEKYRVCAGFTAWVRWQWRCELSIWGKDLLDKVRAKVAR